MKNEAQENIIPTGSADQTNDSIIFNPSINESKFDDIKLPIVISNKLRLGVYIIFVIVSILSALDGGIIPASKEKISMSLSANDEEFGILGSVESFGRIIGSVVFTIIINQTNRKYLLVGVLVGKGLALVVAYFQHLLYLHYALRFISGFCQVFLTIYLPIWCDQYGPLKKRTLMISVIQIGYPFGVVLGYGVYIAIKSWEWAFVIEGICVAVLGVSVLVFPSIYFSNTLALIKGKDNEAYENNEESPLNKLDESRNSSIQPKKSFFAGLAVILCEMVFLFTALSNSVINFVMSIIQFWGPDYLESLFKETTENERFIAFGVLCITSPILGIIFGGVMGTLIGGYTNKKAIVICLALSVISTAFALCISYMNSLFSVAAIIWFFFFFSSGMIPIETGVIISSLPPELRGDGYSAANFIVNLAGNMPPSWIFGKLKTVLSNARKVMEISMYYNLFGVLLLVIAVVFRLRKKEAEETSEVESKEKENEEKEG